MAVFAVFLTLEITEIILCIGNFTAGAALLPTGNDQVRRLRRRDHRPGGLVHVGGRRLERHRREAQVPGRQAAASARPPPEDQRRGAPAPRRFSLLRGHRPARAAARIALGGRIRRRGEDPDAERAADRPVGAGRARQAPDEAVEVDHRPAARDRGRGHLASGSRRLGPHLLGHEPPRRPVHLRRAMAVAFLVFGSIATYSLAGKVRELMQPRTGTAHAAVVGYVILIVGAFTTLVITLELFAVPVGQLVLGGALTSVFVGIAAQQALGNVFAGLVLLFARPFQVGRRDPAAGRRARRHARRHRDRYRDHLRPLRHRRQRDVHPQLAGAQRGRRSRSRRRRRRRRTPRWPRTASRARQAARRIRSRDPADPRKRRIGWQASRSFVTRTGAEVASRRKAQHGSSRTVFREGNRCGPGTQPHRLIPTNARDAASVPGAWADLFRRGTTRWPDGSRSSPVLFRVLAGRVLGCLVLGRPGCWAAWCWPSGYWPSAGCWPPECWPPPPR